MLAEAFCVQRNFPVSGPVPLQFDRHYLLYAQQGAMRLEAQGMRWTLPPARAALIAAGEPLRVTVLSPLCSASVLFAPRAMAPARAVAVFEMTPLARALIAECRSWGESDVQTDYARRLFDALAAVSTRLAERPGPFGQPLPRSAPLSRALALTEAHAQGSPSFAWVARETGQSERALARRFADELGMSWRQMLRRVRIMRAVEQLALGPAPVTNIALAVGYQSLSAFNAAFLDLMGQSPSAYRRSLQGAPLDAG